MKKKELETNNSEKGISFEEMDELSRPKQRVEDKKVVYDLRIMKKQKNKDEVYEFPNSSQSLKARTAVKNYSEMLKVADFEPEKKQANKKSPTIENSKKGIPIYQRIELEEKVKNKNDVYEFIDDLQESGKKVKKQKRSVRKPGVKKARKVSTSKYNKFSKAKIKPIENVSKHMQLKEEKKQPVLESEQNVQCSIYTNIKIPEHLQNAGDSTIKETSTITITSNQILPENNRISPKNTTNFQLITQDSNMSNHCLIRQSMSPITEEVGNIFIGNPRRSLDTSTEDQKVVQSIPQLSRILAEQENESLIQNLNLKSIGSEDTIQLSSITNVKLTQQISTDITQSKEKNVSPRKFGTEILNLNSMKTTTSSIKQVSLQDKQQSPEKAILSATFFENDLEMQDDVSPPVSSIRISDKEDNEILSPNKSSKKEINQLLSPFRFKNTTQSSKQIDTLSLIECTTTENSNGQKENNNPVAGPSDSEKPKALVLRQSNLNNFLNLDKLPESIRISTVDGIFHNIHSTQINRKKPQTFFEESNIENELGFNNFEFGKRLSPIKKMSGPIIATATDVARSVKGKLFMKARVKSSLTRRVPDNMMKKTLLNNILKKNSPKSEDSLNEIVRESDLEHEKSLRDVENERNKSLVITESKKNEELIDAESEKIEDLMDGEIEKNNSIIDAETENNKCVEDVENINEPLNPKKAFLDAISFSDTFDFLSDKGEDLSLEVPDDIPLFVDLEPVHFLQPPRRSYNKRKKTVFSEQNRESSANESSEEDDNVKEKKIKKSESKLNKENQKRMQQWVKSVNEKFNDIEQFNLTVE